MLAVRIKLDVPRPKCCSFGSVFENPLPTVGRRQIVRLFSLTIAILTPTASLFVNIETGLIFIQLKLFPLA